jgi:hypothetical protein
MGVFFKDIIFNNLARMRYHTNGTVPGLTISS